MVLRSKFDDIANQLRQVAAFMQSQFGMNMDGAGPSQPPPPPPQEQQQQVHMDPTDPLRHDDVDQERQDWLWRMRRLEILMYLLWLFVELLNW
ncbi:hypothetical protein Sjap_002838 [Stephania japonica]|uniref:Uncharacterized protein n=1 Tax=Stephania japonica TaxID=461633 RepID=A0AAP0KP54_9MAGN